MKSGRLLGLLLAGALAVTATPAAAQTRWSPLVTMSTVSSNTLGRLCAGIPAGVGKYFEIHCPTYAPSITTAGDVSVTGNLSAAKFLGDGSGLSGITADATDRITSGTTQMVAVSNSGFVSLTQAGTNTGWFSPYTGLVTLGVSASGGISGTTGYFAGNVGIGTGAWGITPTMPLDVVDGIRIRSTGWGNPAGHHVTLSTDASARLLVNSGQIMRGGAGTLRLISGDSTGYSIDIGAKQTFSGSMHSNASNGIVYDFSPVNQFGVTVGANRSYSVMKTTGAMSAATSVPGTLVGSNIEVADYASSIANNIIGLRVDVTSGTNTTAKRYPALFKGGFVGISTSEPNAELDVYGIVSATRFVGDGSGLTNLAGSGDRIVSGTTSIVANLSSSLVFSTAANQRMVLGADGQLTIQKPYYKNGIRINHEDTTSGGQPALAIMQHGGNGWAGAYIMRGRTDGTAGVIFGTSATAPSASTPEWFSGIIRSTNPGGAGFNYVIAAINSGTSALTTGGIANVDSKLTIRPNGNIGIAMVHPQATLQVSGSFIISTSAQTTTPSLYVGTNGFIGVGTSSPSGTGVRSLEIAGTGGGANQYGSLALSNASGSGSNYAGSLDYYTQGNLIGAIRTRVIGGGNTGNMEFFTASAGTFSPVMKLTSAGRLVLGAGTWMGGPATISANASAFNSTTRVMDLYNLQTGQSEGVELGFKSYNASTQAKDLAVIRAQKLSNTAGSEAGMLSFRTMHDGVVDERMRVASDGKVGIGWVTPTVALEVSGTISATHFVGDGSGLTGVAAGSSDRIVSGTANITAHNDASLTFTTAGGQRMVIGDTGKVGIGNDAPGKYLLRVATAQGGGEVYVGAKIALGGNSDEIIGSSGPGHMALRSGVGGFGFRNASGGTIVRVLNGGEVGIGTITPTATLDVSGTVKVAGTGIEGCTPDLKGTMRLNPTSGRMQVCQ